MSCICLDVATLNARTEHGTTSKFTLYSGQGLYFSYSVSVPMLLLLWGSDSWSMAGLGGAPLNVTLNINASKTKPANITNTVSFVYNSPTLSINDVHYESGGHAVNGDAFTQTFVNPPADQPFEFYFQILPATAKAASFNARNVTIRPVTPSAPTPTSEAAVDCFFNQANSNENDAKAACSTCTLDNYDACFGGSGTPSLTYILIAVGLFILGALLVKSLI